MFPAGATHLSPQGLWSDRVESGNMLCGGEADLTPYCVKPRRPNGAAEPASLATGAQVVWRREAADEDWIRDSQARFESMECLLQSVRRDIDALSQKLASPRSPRHASAERCPTGRSEADDDVEEGRQMGLTRVRTRARLAPHLPGSQSQPSSPLVGRTRHSAPGPGPGPALTTASGLGSGPKTHSGGAQALSETETRTGGSDDEKQDWRLAEQTLYNLSEAGLARRNREPHHEPHFSGLVDARTRAAELQVARPQGCTLSPPAPQHSVLAFLPNSCCPDDNDFLLGQLKTWKSPSDFSLTDLDVESPNSDETELSPTGPLDEAEDLFVEDRLDCMSPPTVDDSLPNTEDMLTFAVARRPPVTAALCDRESTHSLSTITETTDEETALREDRPPNADPKHDIIHSSVKSGSPAHLQTDGHSSRAFVFAGADGGGGHYRSGDGEANAFKRPLGLTEAEHKSIDTFSQLSSAGDWPSFAPQTRVHGLAAPCQSLINAAYRPSKAQTSEAAACKASVDGGGQYRSGSREADLAQSVGTAGAERKSLVDRLPQLHSAGDWRLFTPQARPHKLAASCQALFSTAYRPDQEQTDESTVNAACGVVVQLRQKQHPANASQGRLISRPLSEAVGLAETQLANRPLSWSLSKATELDAVTTPDGSITNHTASGRSARSSWQSMYTARSQDSLASEAESYVTVSSQLRPDDCSSPEETSREAESATSRPSDSDVSCAMTPDGEEESSEPESPGGDGDSEVGRKGGRENGTLVRRAMRIKTDELVPSASLLADFKKVAEFEMPLSPIRRQETEASDRESGSRELAISSLEATILVEKILSELESLSDETSISGNTDSIGVNQEKSHTRVANGVLVDEKSADLAELAKSALGSNYQNGESTI